MSRVPDDRGGWWDTSALLRVRYTESPLPMVLGSVAERLAGVPTVLGAGLVLVRGTANGVLRAASAAVRPVDAHQDERAGGPAFEALAKGSCVEVADLGTEQRWPKLTRTAAAMGVEAIVAHPLPTAAPAAVTFYVDGPADPVPQDLLEAVAGDVGVVLSNAMAFTHYGLLTSHLHEALGSRDLIGQAKGMLMERFGISADEAFATLRDASQRTNRKLRDVALEVVEGGTLQ